MSGDALARVVARLQSLPSISLPTDYPRPSGSQRTVEAAYNAELSEQTSLGLLKLALYSENDEEDEDADADLRAQRPSAFHLLLILDDVVLEFEEHDIRHPVGIVPLVYISQSGEEVFNPPDVPGRDELRDDLAVRRKCFKSRPDDICYDLPDASKVPLHRHLKT